ncbi:MAG: M81 family metallopeptidase [Acetobacteraceae bacterium]
MTAKRVALLGFSIECNRFAPTATEADFRRRTWFDGPALLDEARRPAPRMLAELPGFMADMDAQGPWEPVPLLLAMAEPNGPVEHAVFETMMRQWEPGLRGAGRLDGVYVVLHGAGLTTVDDDPEGTLLSLVRGIVGPRIPVVASLDLHANVSAAMVAALDGFVGYRTNPHLDMRERGAECALLLRRLMEGTATHLARVRVPIVAPTVSLLTEPGAANRPYGEVVDLGQRLMSEPPYAGRVLNVSVMAGFAFSDTAYNGLTTVATATDAAAAEALAMELARQIWARRDRFRAELTSLEAAVRLALGGSAKALAFADVADNPGGGGRGNTLHILRAFVAAGVPGAVLGLLHDPDLAADARAAGIGEAFEARFNRGDGESWTVPARVLALHDGDVRGRRGIFAGNSVALGEMALLDVGGVRVGVASRRIQCADPAFLEALGVDLAQVRSLIVKSRGHFRGGFDELFGPDQIVEVDAPGLTSPVLSRFQWTKLPRPVLPLDPETVWP